MQESLAMSQLQNNGQARYGLTSKPEDVHWQPILMVQGRPRLLSHASVMTPALGVQRPEL